MKRSGKGKGRELKRGEIVRRSDRFDFGTFTREVGDHFRVGKAYYPGIHQRIIRPGKGKGEGKGGAASPGLRPKMTALEKRMLDAIRWACGTNGEFRFREEGEGPYYWRRELWERAGLDYRLTKDGQQLFPRNPSSTPRTRRA